MQKFDICFSTTNISIYLWMNLWKSYVMCNDSSTLYRLVGTTLVPSLTVITSPWKRWTAGKVFRTCAKSTTTSPRMTMGNPHYPLVDHSIRQRWGQQAIKKKIEVLSYENSTQQHETPHSEYERVSNNNLYCWEGGEASARRRQQSFAKNK